MTLPIVIRIVFIPVYNMPIQFIDILGFYSEAHKGVFTHHDSNLHMHFKTETVNLAGHVDYIFLGSNMTLKLPEQ